MRLSERNRREPRTLVHEIPAWIVETVILSTGLAIAFLDSTTRSPLSGLYWGVGLITALFGLSRLNEYIGTLGWSPTSGKGRWLVWLVFGITVALIPLSGLLSRLNRRLYDLGTKKLTPPILGGLGLVSLLAIASLQGRHDPLNTLRERVASRPIESDFVLEPGQWEGSLEFPRISQLDTMISQLMDVFDIDQFTAMLTIESVKADTFEGVFEQPFIHGRVRIAGVYAGNQLSFMVTDVLEGDDLQARLIIDLEADDDSLIGRSADGVFKLALERLEE